MKKAVKITSILYVHWRQIQTFRVRFRTEPNKVFGFQEYRRKRKYLLPEKSTDKVPTKIAGHKEPRKKKCISKNHLQKSNSEMKCQKANNVRSRAIIK